MDMDMAMALSTTTGCRQALGHGRRLLVMALVFVFCISLLLEGVHSDTATFAPAPTPTDQPLPEIPIYNQYEVDALNAILTKWSTLNPQLTTLLNWTSAVNPCKISPLKLLSELITFHDYEGAWRGVKCTAIRHQSNSTGDYYNVFVTALKLYGSNSGCSLYSFQCGFEGITGELPSEIGNLTNLESLCIDHNQNLTGPVPIEIFQLPGLKMLNLRNNSLSGTLPSDLLSTNCQLDTIDVSYNNFVGNLPVSPDGSLFCPALRDLSARNNRLDGPLNFENLNFTTYTINLTSNHFNGTLSIGPLFSPKILDISDNILTSIRFVNPNDSNTFMPRTQILNIAKNKLSGQFPNEILQMESLTNLNISYNNFNGTFFTGPTFNPSILDVSNNDLENIIFEEFNKSTTNTSLGYMPLLEELYMQSNSFRGTFPAQILTSPALKTLDCDQNLYEILDLPNLQINNFNLLHLHLTNNQIRGPQYASKGPFTSDNLQYSDILFLGGNPYCNQIKNELLSIVCRFNQSSPRLHVILKSSAKNKMIIATTTSLSFAFMLLVSGTYIWRLMHRIESLRNILKEFEKNEVQPNLYSYKDIKVATNNFDKNHKLGEGGFGVVFKGKLKDNTDVAVKKLIMSSHQVLSDFLHEVVIIAGLKHRNLVKLKGCCLGDGDQRMLVFEYVENKNLVEALWPHALVNMKQIIWKALLNLQLIIGIQGSI